MTAFTTKYGLYEWKVIPFGLANAPSAFMRMMDSILAKHPHLRKHVVIYMDDILVHTKDPILHNSVLRQLLGILRTEGLKLKEPKCQFFRKAVDFVGFFVDAQGLHMENSKIASIRDWPTPKTIKES